MAKTIKLRALIFATFVMSCLSVSILTLALGTRGWLGADCVNDMGVNGSGSAKFGLFSGEATLILLSTTTNRYKIVCLDDKCMYSAGETKEDRKDSINATLNEENTTLLKYQREGNLFVTDMVEDSPELMNEALWIATICLLCCALLFAVIGAVFAVINTATTPIEFITGVPGLYIWNGAAALFALACAICWGVQYHNHLKSNVLVEDASEGWTTEGLQHLGYSYWLVIVSAIVHLDNCVLIAIGTYERKVTPQFKAPETKSRDIMLY